MEQFGFYKGIMKVICLQCWMPIGSALLVESMGKLPPSSPCFAEDKEISGQTQKMDKKQWIDKLLEMTWKSLLCLSNIMRALDHQLNQDLKNILFPPPGTGRWLESSEKAHTLFYYQNMSSEN